MLKMGWLKGILNSRIFQDVKMRIVDFHLTDDMVVRMRIILFLTAILAFYLSFAMGDDWWVREYANYDWARRIGY